MYNCANLFSYRFYIQSYFILSYIFYILYEWYTIMCINQINNLERFKQNFWKKVRAAYYPKTTLF